MSVNEKMTAIADRLRGYAQKTDKLTLDKIASEIDVAFRAGVEIGQELLGLRSKPDSITTDEFWDVFQANGMRKDYSYAFYGDCFNDKLFTPKYSMTVTNAERMFTMTTSITDLSAVKSSDGRPITIDFSQCNNFNQAFQTCTGLQKVGDISTVSATDLYLTFQGCRSLTTVGVFTVNEETTYTNTFAICTSLEQITFSGTIGQDLKIQWCPLNRASIESIVRCLSAEVKDKSKTLTLKSGIVDAAFETSSGASDGESAFLDLVDELGKDGWNFSY